MLSWRNRKDRGDCGPKSEDNGFTPDAELVRAARRGDKRAFIEIVAHHQAMVCGIALGILGDFAASEDAGQETFLTAWRKLHELREPEHLRAWLAQIARNAALGHLRRKRPHESMEDALNLPDPSTLPDENAAKEDDAELVRAFLSRLPENYRLPLVLYYREGQSVRAVAETIGIGEDAVKQRLARGREMLREQMSGAVEKVLARTAPTAIFTMAIAVAIGALAAPAAVAGGVFAATSTASATSSTSIFAAMSTSKTFLVTAALIAVAFIPVGYHFSSGTSTQVHADLPVVTKTSSNTLASITSFEKSALFVEWRDLHAKYGTNAPSMPAIYKAIADIKDSFRRRAFNAALIAEWVQVDAAGGLKFYLGKGPDNNQRRQFIEEWLALDPRAAVAALLASDGNWQGAVRGCLNEIARRVPAKLADVVSRLPEPENNWDSSVRDAFAIVAEGDLDSARKSAESITITNREQSLAGVAQAWAKRDLESAIAWAKSLPDGVDRNQVIRAALLGVAAVNPTLALDSVNLVPSGGRAAYFADTTGARVLSATSETDFDATISWLTSHPGKLGQEDLTGLSKAVSERLNADPIGFLNNYSASGALGLLLPAINSALLNDAAGQRSAVWEWLKTQPQTEFTKSLKAQALSSAAWQDPDSALRWVDDLPKTPEGDAELKTLAERLFNGGNSLARFEKLYAEAPERLRQPLVESAFHFLGNNRDIDPQQWLSRLSLLPDESARTKGIESIARGWAFQSPEQAANWESSLPAGEARNGAAAAIASTWALVDPHGAANWLGALPSGAERDRSAESFSMTIAERYPREAWQWAVSIGDDAGRNRAASMAVKTMAARDPATARQWIESGPFSPETRAQLQASLTHPTK